MSSIWKRIAVVTLLGAAAFLLWRIPPEDNKAISQCPLLKHTGLYCSGCGSLRSIHFLLQDEFSNAWKMNPLAVISLPLIAVLAGAELLFNRYDLANRIQPRWIWTLLIIYVLFGILRNLPFHPFTLLAPH